ncbi:hypothetical protein SUGI_0020720 [Cryptomeria japonica]|nr:hypothetical protein SUGI_0020720 [Cryptomeria japonica]
MLGAFRTANGQFLCSTVQTEEDKIRGILNLFRASHIAFPGEKILDEAKQFSTTYLNQAMQNSGISSNLLQEISFNLEYGWYSNLPRLEARKYIQIYGQNKSWNFFFLACAICEDERYSTFRYGLVKLCAIATYIDDIYDTYGTFDEVKLLTEAIKKWDPTSIDHLPEYMQILYLALHETVNEMHQEVEKIQGRDTLIPSRDVVWIYFFIILELDLSFIKNKIL